MEIILNVESDEAKKEYVVIHSVNFATDLIINRKTSVVFRELFSCKF
jgi:hypothetical protein